jgi:hypothetical protein
MAQKSRMQQIQNGMIREVIKEEKEAVTDQHELQHKYDEVLKPRMDNNFLKFRPVKEVVVENPVS